MNKISIYISLLLISVGVILYTCSTSATKAISEAKEKLKNGDTDTALTILQKAYDNDDSSIEISTLLAQLYENKNDYSKAAFFWNKAYDINPNESIFYKNKWRCLAVSKDENSIIKIYNQELKNKKNPSEYAQYLYAMSLYKNKKIYEAKEIQARLKNQNSPFAQLLEANFLLSKKKIPEAKNIFEKLNKIEDVKNQSNFGLAVCAYVNSDINGAKEFLKQILNCSDDTTTDALMMKTQIALNEDDEKGAIATLKKLCNIDKNNIPNILLASEIAFTLNDIETIKELHSFFQKNTRNAQLLTSYLLALQKFLESDFETAQKLMDDSENFKQSSLAKLVNVKILLANNKDAQAIALIETIDTKNLRKYISTSFAGEIKNLLKKYSDKKIYTEILSELLIRFEPDNTEALKTVLESSLVKANYKTMLDVAKKLYAKFPEEKSYRQSYITALLFNEKFKDGLALINEDLKKNPDDIFALTMASKFNAALEDMDSAINYCLKISKIKDAPTSTLIEAGSYIRACGKNDEFDKFLSNLKNQKSDEKTACAQLLCAIDYLQKKDLINAENYFEKSINTFKKNDSAYIFYAIAKYSQNNLQKSIDILSNGLKENPDSVQIKARLSSLLLEKNTPESASKAEKMLEEITKKNPLDAKAYAYKSAALAMQNKLDEAFDSAKYAYSIAPKDSDVLMQLAHRLIEKNQCEAALEALLRISPKERNREFPSVLSEAFQGAAKNCKTDETKTILAKTILKAFPNYPEAIKLLKDIKK